MSSTSRDARLPTVPFDESVVQGLPIAAVLCDRAGRLLCRNRAAAALWRGEVLPAQVPAAAVLASGSALSDVEILIERAEGGPIRCLVDIMPLRDAAQAVAGALICFRPIAGAVADPAAEQRFQALEAQVEERTAALAGAVAELREADRHFRLLIKSVSDYAIFMLDIEGRVANWNSGAERIKGYSEAEVIGRHFSIFYTDAIYYGANLKDYFEREFTGSFGQPSPRPTKYIPRSEERRVGKECA